MIALNANTPTQHLVQPEDLPRGISVVRQIPEPSLDALWDSIIVDDGLKGRLLAQAMLIFSLRPKV